MKKYLLVGLFWCLFFENLNAQTYDFKEGENSFIRNIRANQTESYITFGQGIGNGEPLIFEGLIAPYFLLRTRRNARFGATLSPAILIRMQNKKSFPVKSPSYMPSLTIYRQLIAPESNGINSSYVFFTFEHHSNGQSGNFYKKDGSFNTETGDFSTNLMELGFFINRKVLPFFNTTEYFRASIEIHPNIGRSEELNGQYSFVRLHNSFRMYGFSGHKPRIIQDGSPVLPRVQTKAETTWMFGEIRNAALFNAKERLNLSFTIAYSPKILTDISFFLNFYSGKDYYNMQFSQRINVIRFGLLAFHFK